MSDITLAEKLHQEFVCAHCGFCCLHGGQIKITKSELEIIGEFLDVSIACASLVPVRELESEPGVFMLTVTEPCFFMDKMCNTCMVHLVKPRFCRDYPWLLYLKGGCTLLDVMCCPVARAQIEVVFK